MTRPRGALAAALAAALAVGSPTPSSAYLKFGVRVGGRSVTLRWNRLPVRYFVSDRGVAGLTPGQFQGAVARAFATWQDVPTASVSFQFVGFTGSRPLDDDNISVLGFLDRPELERVLAATGFLIDTTTGEILESDIFFNASFPWSVAPAGETGRFDLESIALHEIGHLIGLGHSALGETELRPTGGRRVIAAESVMFPIAFAAGDIADRTLRPDDRAGVSDIYPDGDFTRATGSISGRVTKNGGAVFGAHVVAFDTKTGTLVGNFSLTDRGEFTIAGLSPGVYVLRAEPLDDGDVESFFERATNVDLDFQVTFHDRLGIAPRGGSSSQLEIKVRPK